MRYEVEKQIRTWRSWFEGASEDLDYGVLPDVVRHCAWQIACRLVRSDGKKQTGRPRGRPHNGQVSEFAEMNHFRDPQKAAEMSKVYDRWSLRLWMGSILVLGGHYGCTPARVRRCRSIRKRPENLRWVKKVLNEIIGDSWDTSPRQEEKLQPQCGVYVTLKPQIRYGGQKGCTVCVADTLECVLR